MSAVFFLVIGHFTNVIYLFDALSDDPNIGQIDWNKVALCMRAMMVINVMRISMASIGVD